MKNTYDTMSREALVAELIKYKEIADMFTNSVVGGVAKMSLKDMRIINATEGYYNMTGYTQAESLEPPFSNCGINLVVAEDIPRIHSAIETLVQQQKAIHVKYRIHKKDGSIVWNSAFCSRIQSHENGQFIDVFFLDITQEQEQQKQNLLNEERFRIISEQTRDVIFEWDIEHDLLHYSSAYEKVYGSEPPPKSTKELMKRDLFHEDDKSLVLESIEALRTNQPYVEFKARLRQSDGSYYWALHRAAAIRDENSNPTHVVGIINNVTDFVENALSLQHKAEHDPLTGLLNRGAAQTITEQILARSDKHQQHAFIQFDIDRFKQINDFMGHAAGDLVLQKIASQMKMSFRDSDVLVRMGGDEFIIVLSDTGNRKNISRKLSQFIRDVCCDFVYEEKIYPLSISIGVALYPEDGKTFQQLYISSDAALYRAKRCGGGCIDFFSKHL